MQALFYIFFGRWRICFFPPMRFKIGNNQDNR